MKILKELKGHSNSQILLIEDNGCIFVRKNFDTERNIERYNVLSSIDVPIPKILKIDKESYDMEYIQHLDIKHFLSMNDAKEVLQFIIKILTVLKHNSVDCDYSDIFKNKLEKFNFEKYNLPFTKEELYEKLPKVLPQSSYHGDLTLENIIFNTVTKDFVLIDPLTTDYNSYVFDIAKLKQDLICKWFIRNDEYHFDSKLKIILEGLNQFKYHDNNYLLILMLMRVIPYTKNKSDEDFLLTEMRKLWK